LNEAIVGKIGKDFSIQENEQKILLWWKKSKIYDKIKKKIKNKSYYFLDGPPYVTNPPHVGTVWNKTLKDAIIRYKRMQGYHVRDQPGYDCHGLPIEVKVEEDLKVKTKRDIENEFGIKNFIDRCKNYAIENVKIQTEIFENIGIWMDWKKPYLTFEDEYIESVWWSIKKADEKGLLEKGLKVVHWCPRCETALAGYEVTDEYRTIKDHSIFVKFPIKDRKNEYIIIWTTTPWTLPSNVAIMVEPDSNYVKVQVEDEFYILAKARVEGVISKINKPYKILEVFKGRDLEGLAYEPSLLEEVPLQNEIRNAHSIILSKEYVTMDEGTGCVHVAPGHGEEDFDVGLKYNLPAICPVNESGIFSDKAGKYKGMYVFEANKFVVNDLKEKGLLLNEELITHSYPHCWRCKTPLILRATEQWFIKITEVKEKLLKENDNVLWTPKWAGSKRFKDWLSGARDWVISRQRYWGVPLPIWICEDCKEKLVIGLKDELKKIATNLPQVLDLHRSYMDKIYLKCKCGGAMKRVPDIVDVWLDSGVASWACLGYPKKQDEFRKWWPADLIIEAHDQTRGWFYTQLGAGITTFDKTPYKSVIMHGHALDSNGQKMSKSLGTFVSPEDVIKKYGRDSLRLYLLQHIVWEDFRFSWVGVEEIWKFLQVVWNVYAFASLYMNLDLFSPKKWKISQIWSDLSIEDKWLISKVESLKVISKENMDNHSIHVVVRSLMDFALEDLSRWYIKLVRRRFWLERESKNKISAYVTLYHALKNFLVLSTPFMPFLTEKLYNEVIKPAETDVPESVHLNDYPAVNSKYIDKKLEQDMEIVKEVTSAILSARQEAGIKLRQPLNRIIIATTEESVKEATKKINQVLIEQANVKKIEYIDIEQESKLKKLRANPDYRLLGPSFKNNANLVADKIKSVDGSEIYESFQSKGKYELVCDEEKFIIKPEMISFKEEMPEEFFVGSFAKGRIYLDAKIPKDLLEEGLSRDIVRRIQEMRKTMDLPVDAYISTQITIPSEREKKWIEKSIEFIEEETRSKELILSDKANGRFSADFEKKWKINDLSFEIRIKRI
jgi:isoleucyl-tRNA synthetase